MNTEWIKKFVTEIETTLGTEARMVPFNETFLSLPPDHIHRTIEILTKEYGVYHLSTITGQDTGDAIELLYHFWSGQGLTLHTKLSRGHSQISSITDLVPGAEFYEREIREMLHVDFSGLETPQGMLLPDDWDGGAPLRKE